MYFSLASSEDVYAIRWAAGKAAQLPLNVYGSPGRVLRISSDGDDGIGWGQE